MQHVKILRVGDFGLNCPISENARISANFQDFDIGLFANTFIIVEVDYKLRNGGEVQLRANLYKFCCSKVAKFTNP